MKGMKFSFKRLFGSKGSTAIPGSSKKADKSNKNTLERLREMEELLQKKQAHLETKIEEHLADARKFGKKNKRAALMALKRKKRLEEELIRIDGTLTTIELQREALEAARNNVQVLAAMKDAASVLKNAQKFVTVDKVLDIMDEVNEQQDLSKEIADAIANPLGRTDSLEDTELEKELEEMEHEELHKALLYVEKSEIPSVSPGSGHSDANHKNVDTAIPGSSSGGRAQTDKS